MLGLVIVFYLLSAATKRPRLGTLGLGLGIRMLMHSLLDLVIWFRGVELFWPLHREINLWSGYTPPAWWYSTFELALEFLLIAFFFVFLASLARKKNTNLDFLKNLKTWIWVQFGLFGIFLVLVYTWNGFFIPYGAFYILSLGLSLGVTVRMEETIEAI